MKEYKLVCGKYTGTTLYDGPNYIDIEYNKHNILWVPNIMNYIKEIIIPVYDQIYIEIDFKTELPLEKIINSLKSNDPEIVKMMLCIIINSKI
jgi:hypothetical protein